MFALYILLRQVDDPDSIELPKGIVPDPPNPEEFCDEAATARANGGLEEEPAGQADVPEPAGGGDAAATDEGPTAEDDSGRSLTGGGPLETLGLAAKGVRTARDLLAMEDEVKTSLRGDIQRPKRAGWTDELDLEKVSAIGDAHDATINGVLLAVLAGAFRRLLEDRGEDVGEIGQLRVTVPVNLHPMAERDETLGNYFGLVFVPLLIGMAPLDERIRIIHERMDEQKAGIQSYLTLTPGGCSPDPVFE